MKRKYNERVLNVERGSFTPAVFLTTGGMSLECKRLVNRLAELYAIKKKNQYQEVVRYIRIKIRFALLRSCLVAVITLLSLGAELAMITLLQMCRLASFQIIQLQNNFVLH